MQSPKQELNASYYPSSQVSDVLIRYPVRIKCDEAYLVNFNGYKLIEMASDGWYTFDMISESIAISQLFNHGDHIVILSPEPLVEAILKKAKHIVSHYEKKNS